MSKPPYSESLGQWLAALDLLGRADERTVIAADVVALLQGMLLAVVLLSTAWSGSAILFSFGAFLLQTHWALKIFLTRSSEAFPPIGQAVRVTEIGDLAHIGSWRAYRGFLAGFPISLATMLIATLRN